MLTPFSRCHRRAALLSICSRGCRASTLPLSRSQRWPITTCPLMISLVAQRCRPRRREPRVKERVIPRPPYFPEEAFIVFRRIIFRVAHCSPKLKDGLVLWGKVWYLVSDVDSNTEKALILRRTTVQQYCCRQRSHVESQNSISGKLQQYPRKKL